jgi:uncharacterized membrane protein
MILYNTLMGICAGLGLILIAILGKKLYHRETIAPEGWALALGSVGLILAILSGIMAVTWPLTVNPPINILFAEPNLLFGVLLVAAALFLWRRSEVIMQAGSKNKKTAEEATDYLRRVLLPVSWIVFGLGLVLAFSAAAIIRFNIVGAAPEVEPITGLLHEYPLIENTFFGTLYGLSAIGALLTPFALQRPNSKLRTIIGYCWVIAGVVFLIFSALNYYTHTGMLTNILNGTNLRW